MGCKTASAGRWTLPLRLFSASFCRLFQAVTASKTDCRTRTGRKPLSSIIPHLFIVPAVQDCLAIDVEQQENQNLIQRVRCQALEYIKDIQRLPCFQVG